MMLWIIGTDNHNRETIADVLWLDNIDPSPMCKDLAQRVCDKLNARLGNGPGTYYKVVTSYHRLSRGMEDLV